MQDMSYIFHAVKPPATMPEGCRSEDGLIGGAEAGQTQVIRLEWTLDAVHRPDATFTFVMRALGPNFVGGGGGAGRTGRGRRWRRSRENFRTQGAGAWSAPARKPFAAGGTRVKARSGCRPCSARGSVGSLGPAQEDDPEVREALGDGDHCADGGGASSNRGANAGSAGPGQAILGVA